MLRRRLSMRRLCLTLVIFLLAIMLYIGFRVTSIIDIIPKGCTNLQSKQILDNLCELYQKEIVDGNLCSALCTAKSIHYNECLFNGKGKKVISVTYNSKTVIFKSKYETFQEYELLFGTAENEGFAPPDMDYTSFMSLFKSHLETLMGIKLADKEYGLLSRMWTSPVEPGDELTHAEMNSLWSLVQQSEYNYLKYFHSAEFMPEIYGSCGHFYAVEFIPSGAILDPKLLSLSEQWDSAPWSNRAWIALGLLKLIESTETFHTEILHLCDVKPDNFGVADGFLVKAIDIDISFFTTQMKEFLQQPECSANEDCDFFDCHGACDTVKNKCLDIRTNNNFQAICADIFLPHHATPGLLRNPPADIAPQVDNLLALCVEPPPADQVETSSQTKTFQNLQDLLRKSVTAS